MNKSIKAILILLSSAFLTISCGNDSDATESELRIAEAAGRRDALKAVENRNSVMACEKAILAIRIRETELREHGFDACADRYSESAHTILKDSLIID